MYTHKSIISEKFSNRFNVFGLMFYFQLGLTFSFPQKLLLFPCWCGDSPSRANHTSIYIYIYIYQSEGFPGAGCVVLVCVGWLGWGCAGGLSRRLRPLETASAANGYCCCVVGLESVGAQHNHFAKIEKYISRESNPGQATM